MRRPTTKPAASTRKPPTSSAPARTKPNPALTGQQFQSAGTEPYYVLFEDFTHVKFYRRSLYDGIVLQGGTFNGSHVDDWVPQRLVTATGPNPLPR